MTAHHVATRTDPVPMPRAKSRRHGPSYVTTTRNLLTGSWTADVAVLEAAVDRFNDEGLVTNECTVAFFEVALDKQLHVNVTHKYLTRTVAGWAGPARTPDGFVHNRRFGDRTPNRIIRYIRDMVFAARG